MFLKDLESFRIGLVRFRELSKKQGECIDQEFKPLVGPLLAIFSSIQAHHLDLLKEYNKLGDETNIAGVPKPVKTTSV